MPRDGELRQGRCIVEKHGGALWRVRIYRIKPYLVTLMEVEN